MSLINFINKNKIKYNLSQSELDNLHYLILNHSKLNRIPHYELQKLKLSYLDLSNNNLRYFLDYPIPHLDISNNKLTYFKNSHHFNEINLNYNNIKKINIESADKVDAFRNDLEEVIIGSAVNVDLRANPKLKKLIIRDASRLKKLYLDSEEIKIIIGNSANKIECCIFPKTIKVTQDSSCEFLKNNKINFIQENELSGNL